MKAAPFRIQMEFTLAAKDLDRATTLHDRVLDLAEGMGLLYEGGFVGKMQRRDVIDGSPLDRKLDDER